MATMSWLILRINSNPSINKSGGLREPGLAPRLKASPCWVGQGRRSLSMWTSRSSFHPNVSRAWLAPKRLGRNGRRSGDNASSVNAGYQSLTPDTWIWSRALSSHARRKAPSNGLLTKVLQILWVWSSGSANQPPFLILDNSSRQPTHSRDKIASINYDHKGVIDPSDVGHKRHRPLQDARVIEHCMNNPSSF